MTATDELRRMLDERGVEYETGETVDGETVATFWYDREGYPCSAIEGADDIPDGEINMQACVTPEQAIAATVGRGTCKWKPADFITEGDWWDTECGESFIWEPDGTPNCCPNCGRRVVEVVDE